MDSREGSRGGLGMDPQQQQFCLKWNSFGSNLATSFANLWNSESLADVTLYCEGRHFKAHKLILSACSKHFQELFDAAPPSHAGACFVILEATSADNMQALLEFMYKGEVHVSQEALASFLRSGESLQVKGLSQEQGNWAVAQSQQFAAERHLPRSRNSPARSGAETPDSAPQQPHAGTFTPIMPQYLPGLHSASPLSRYVAPAHMPQPPSAHHRRPLPPKPSPSPSQSPHTRNYRQSSSSSHGGTDEPDTRSSPGGGAGGAGNRYEPDAGPECTSTHNNTGTKNNGYEMKYERSSSAADDPMDPRLASDQGAEDLRVKSEPEYNQGGGVFNTSPLPNPPVLTTNYQDRPPENSPAPIKPQPDIWSAKLASSKSGGIATADGKKLKCPFCDRLYGYETNLRAHIRQRHQGIRVPCPHCTRTFTRNNTVRRHIAREHRHQVAAHLPQGVLHNHAQ